MKQLFNLRAAVNGGFRTDSFQQREHIVVPVVALVEGVIFASNSETPELVLAEEFGKAPQGWNGRPVVGDHPSENGARVSANHPRVLESQAFGHVFNVEVRGNKLLMEAWIDPARVAKIGGQAERTLSRIKSGETTEVSVGVFVTADETKGVWKNGKPYGAIWRDILPDHLAMLPEGTSGACSVQMGCGTRAASEKLCVLCGEPTTASNDCHDERGQFCSGGAAGLPGSGVGTGHASRTTASGSTAADHHAAAALHDKAAQMHLQRGGGEVPEHVALATNDAANSTFLTVHGKDGKFYGDEPSPTLDRLLGKANDYAERATFADKKGSAASYHRSAAEVHRQIAAHLTKTFKAPKPKGAEMSKKALTVLNTLKGQETFRSNLLELMTFRSATPNASGELSDTDLRQALEAALRAVEPGFLGVEAVYADSVIYACAPEDKVDFYQVDYKMADGEASLGKKRVEVKPMTKYEPVGASTSPTTACGCGQQTPAVETPAATTEEEDMKEVSAEKKARVAALIAKLAAKKDSPFQASDAQLLEQWPDERLVTLEASVETKEAPKETPVPVVLSAEAEQKAFFDRFPSIRAAVDAEANRVAARKSELVTKLKTAQKAYNEDELKALEIPALEKIDSMLAEVKPKAVIRDFSGSTMTRTASDKDDPDVPPTPIDLTERIRAARAKSA